MKAGDLDVQIERLGARGVRFSESPYLRPSSPLNQEAWLLTGVMMDRDGLLLVVGPPGSMQPERIGDLVNDLRERGYTVEVTP